MQKYNLLNASIIICIEHPFRPKIARDVVTLIDSQCG